MKVGTRWAALALLALLTGCAEYGDYDDDWDDGGSDTTTVATPRFPDGRSYHQVTSCSKPARYQSDPAFTTPPAGMDMEAWHGILGEIDRDEENLYAICRQGRLYATDYAPNVQKYGTVKP
jgi:hypothetical protein